MKIIEKSDTVLFKDLESGDVFRFVKIPKTYYMKVKTSGATACTNCVNLETGEFDDISDFSEVLFMKDATLTI